MSAKKKVDEQALLRELKQRVLEIDSKRNLGEENNVKHYVDALAEVTSLKKEEIEAIASELIAEQESRKTIAERFTEIPGFYKKSLFLLVGIAVFIIVIPFKYIIPSVATGSNAATDIQATNRATFVRAKLYNILARTGMLKTASTEYFMYSGEFAKDIKELGVDVAELESVDGIKSIKIVNAGTIEIALAAEFGGGKVLQIQPSASKSGQFLEWKCKTNLEQMYLGPTNNTSCTSDQSISLGSN